MALYETLFITPAELAEDEEHRFVDGLSQVVRDAGAELLICDRMGRRRLAYPIRKVEEGVYTRLLYESGADVPTELERRVRLSDQVLRSLTVRLEREWAEAAREEARDLNRRAAEAEQKRREEAEAAAQAAPPEEAEKPAEGAEPAAEREEAERAGPGGAAAVGGADESSAD